MSKTTKQYAARLFEGSPFKVTSDTVYLNNGWLLSAPYAMIYEDKIYIGTPITCKGNWGAYQAEIEKVVAAKDGVVGWVSTILPEYRFSRRWRSGTMDQSTKAERILIMGCARYKRMCLNLNTALTTFFEQKAPTRKDYKLARLAISTLYLIDSGANYEIVQQSITDVDTLHAAMSCGNIAELKLRVYRRTAFAEYDFYIRYTTGPKKGGRWSERRLVDITGVMDAVVSQPALDDILFREISRRGGLIFNAATGI